MAQLKVSLENIIPLTEARDHFSQIVNDVQRDKLYVLTKGGKPVIALIDVRYLESISGGSINTLDVEKEILKDPTRVGRTAMIKTVSAKEETKPASTPSVNPTNQNNGFTKPTFSIPTFNKPNTFKAVEKPLEEKPPVTASAAPAKINFQPSAPKPAFTPYQNTPSNSTNPNLNQPKPANPPYQPSYNPAPKPATPTPFSPAPTTTTPTPAVPTPASIPVAPFTPPNPISNPTPTPIAQPATPQIPQTYNPPTFTSDNVPKQNQTTVTPAPTVNPAPTVVIPVKPTPDENSGSISVTSTNPMATNTPQNVTSPITMQNNPTTNPIGTMPSPAPISSGSGLAINPTMPSANSGSNIDIIPSPEDLNTTPKPMATDAVFSPAPAPTQKPVTSTSGDLDDMPLD